jgi:tRNA threonylcarbamoyladenosine biosynthesis protein TsaE
LRDGEQTLRTASAGETEKVGAGIAAGLRAGDVVLVSGEVGTGKTTLIRGACRALGVSDPIVSPTFTVGRRYRGRIPVSHLDLYRLTDLEEEEPALLADYLTPDAIAFVEWPEIAAELARTALSVRLRHDGGDRREIAIAPRAREGRAAAQ